MKSQLDLQVAITEDQLSLLGIPATRDIATMISRVETRGESFLTLEMPLLAQALERGLDDGQLKPENYAITRPRSTKDVRPIFLGALFERIFDESGAVLETADSDAVRAVRQICYLHAKLKELPTPDKVEAAFKQYLETDANIVWDVSEELREQFRRTSRKMWGRHFRQMEKVLFEDTFLSDSKHGPGVVAEHLTSNGKWANSVWTERLSTVFPAYEYLTHAGITTGKEFDLLPPGEEVPARVLAVPKTAKGPRIITAEPVYNQFIQQGLSAMFTRWMNFHPVVSFQDQQPNRDLARQGSIDGRTVTLDLSEASDRVSLAIVKLLLRDNPLLLEAVLACRSQRSVLEDGTVVLLRKFASMGSALTFPIEGLVFATISQMAIENTSSTGNSTLRRGEFRVYGDDIIVPKYAADETVRLLEAFGLKVNVHKSFTKGDFRESCGGDFFRGRPVNPVRVRKRLPQTRRDVDEVVAIVAFRNLYWEQYGHTKFVTFLDQWIGEVIPFPYGHKETDALVRWGHTVYPDGMDPYLHRPYVYGVKAKYHFRDDPLDGVAALLKFFWTPFQEDKKHLQRAGRPISAKLRYGKVLL